MNTKLFTVIALMAAFAPMSALSQQQPSAPKASKADVQKVIDSIKGDKSKMAAYCDSSKLDDQIEAIAAKNQNDPKLKSLYAQLAASNKKVGSDFQKIMDSELDQASGALLEDLAKSCP
jgi:hypothetical protein